MTYHNSDRALSPYSASLFLAVSSLYWLQSLWYNLIQRWYTVLCVPYSTSIGVRLLLMVVNHFELSFQDYLRELRIWTSIANQCGSHICSLHSAYILDKQLQKWCKELSLRIWNCWSDYPYHLPTMWYIICAHAQVTCGFEPLQPYQSPHRMEHIHTPSVCSPKD